MWFMIFIFLICFSIFYWFDFKRNNENVRKTQIGEIMTEMFGLLVALGTINLSIQPKRVISNPLIFWIFFCFFIRQFFSSDITSLILSKTELKFDSLDQLLEHEDYDILVKESFKIKEYPKFSIFPYPSFIKRSKVIPHRNYFSFDTISRLIFEKNVCILSKENLKKMAEFYPKYKFHVSKESYFSILLTFPLRKSYNQSLRLKLINLLIYIYQHGMDQKIDRTFELQNYKFLSFKKKLTEITEVEDEINRKQVVYESSKQINIRILSIYGIGIFISFVFFLLELALQKIIKFKYAI